MTGNARHLRAWYGLTIFCSAFLLFQVQPIIGKIILPWFGGTPATWTSCLLFFQVTLLAGYLYAHLLGSLVRGKAQVFVHLGLLLASLIFLPFTPGAAWKPEAGGAPALQVLLLLLVHIGGPFFLLSSTNPLLQRWYSRGLGGASPYRFYALSNTGSLLALVTYPFLVEPSLAVRRQVLAWSGLYLLYAAGSAVCAVLFLRAPRPEAQPAAAGPRTDKAPRPAAGDVALWLLLAAAASALLMATTNQLCQEVAAVPFLWILPLCLYLLSFIICFDSERWYDRRVWGALLLLSVPLATHVLVRGVRAELVVQIPALALALFACCMTCHGEIVRAKPAPRYLTLYYLVIATGGALGGVFVALAAPRWFGGYWEFPIALVACCLLTFLAWYRQAPWRRVRVRPAVLWGGLGGFTLLLALTLTLQAIRVRTNVLCVRRNFFGVLSVKRVGIGGEDGAPREARAMLHGRINHGFQFADPDRARQPTAYFGPGTGIYYAMGHHPRRNAAGAPGTGALQVGVVGLGTGTLAALAQPGDRIRFYEINPDVVELAHDYFTYLDDTPARVEIVLGDGRLELEREADAGQLQAFDLLAMDAFISDAVPIHLLTAECIEVCRRHLKPDGLLAMNISNRFVDLVPVILGLAARFDLHACFIDSARDGATGVSISRWAILAPDKTFSERPEVRPHLNAWSGTPPDPLLWTDDFASLWDVIVW